MPNEILPVSALKKEKTDCQYLPSEKITSSSLKFYNARCSNAKLAPFVLKAWMKAILSHHAFAHEVFTQILMEYLLSKAS